MPLPIFQEHGKTYQADRCQPLVRAVERGELELVALARGQYPGRKLNTAALPGIKTIGCWDAQHAQDWGLDWHRNEGIELTFLERGGIDFAVDRRTAHLRPGDLTVTRPWQQHRLGNPNIGAGRLHWLILDVGVRRPHQPWQWPSWLVLTKPDLQELTKILRHNERPIWRATPEVRHCFQRIAAAVETAAISRLAALLNELFVLVLEMLRQQRVTLDESLASTERTVELFWTDLQQNLDHLAAPWTVETMARQCGLGVTHFIHHSKQLTNTTPIAHLNHCRLEAAAALLKKEPARSVTDVAFACGFTSSQYFATQFRRLFNRTPRDYRQSASC